MILLVNGKGYHMKRKKALQTLKVIRDGLKGRNVIFAVEKGDCIECRNDKFSCALDLLNEQEKWNKKGFKVHCTKKY